jgi:multiple antibiotic resistance protein
MIWPNPAVAALNELSQAPLVRFSLLAFSSIFFLVDPFGAIPSFMAITASADSLRRKRTARKAAITCFIVLTSFAVGGQMIFKLFGITLPAFEIAGGLILLLIGLEMLQAKRSATQEVTGDTEEASQKEDAGIVPLGIPMLAGPGAISTVMVMVGQVPNLWRWEMGAIVASITVTSLVSYLVLSGAERVRRVLGETGIHVLVRVMGLLLVALAVQCFINGLMDLKVVPRL